MKAKQWLKIFIFAVIIAALTIGASFFLRVPEPRDTVGMYGFYLEEENSLDVVLIGTSSVYTSFYSPLAYEKQGFTSYPVSTAGMCGSMYPSAVRETLQTQDPELFVVDLSGFCFETQTNLDALHRWIDNIRSGPNQKESIRELVPEQEQKHFQIPFLKYHSNWPNFTYCMKSLQDKNAQKKRGFSVSKNFTVYTGIDDSPMEEYVFDFSEEGMEALETFLAFLKEEHLENVLFVRFPYKDLVKDGDNYRKGIEKIRAEGFDVLDYWGDPGCSSELQLDLARDYHDLEHLTVFGAEKLTEHLAAYIDQHYQLKKEYSTQTKAEWEEATSFVGPLLEKAERATLETKAEELCTQKDFLQ